MVKSQGRLQFFVFFLCLLLPMISLADVPTWQIVPNESHLTFTATQNNAPVTGEFKKFSGDIHFDPDQLNASHVKITVDVNSISDPYHQLSDTLITPDWFDTKDFPKAVFQSNHFTKTGDKTYQAEGTLTLRNITLPITLSFTQEQYTPTQARIKGTATLKRTPFHVGQGEWSDTKAVKDEVTINFEITAVKK